MLLLKPLVQICMLLWFLCIKIPSPDIFLVQVSICRILCENICIQMSFLHHLSCLFLFSRILLQFQLWWLLNGPAGWGVHHLSLIGIILDILYLVYPLEEIVVLSLCINGTSLASRFMYTDVSLSFCSAVTITFLGSC